ncbi:MAG: T9SS type A sorting domain-containing protein [FCB group bacterium]|jgi:hypothetical protein
MKNLFAIVVAIFLYTMPLFSQRDTSHVSHSIFEFTKHEKFRFSPAELLKNKNNNLRNYNGNDKKREQTLGNREKIVSDDSLPESEVHAVINPKDSNNIVLSYIKQDMYNPSTMYSCPIFYTKDFGMTWKQSNFMTNTSNPDLISSFGGDPVLTFDADGTAYLFWINVAYTINDNKYDSTFGDICWAYSTDGGENWLQSKRQYISRLKAKYEDTGYFGLDSLFDKEWANADRSNSIYKGNIYVTCTLYDYDSSYSGVTSIIIFRKEKGKQEFLDTPSLVFKADSQFVQFSSIDIDNNGYIHVSFYAGNYGKHALYHTVSKDGGVSFIQPVKISDFNLKGSYLFGSGDQNGNILGVNQYRLYPSPEIAVDKSTKPTAGNIYYTWTSNAADTSSISKTDIYFSRSTDIGNTWSNPIKINDNKNVPSTNQFYSSICVNEGGVLAATWYDRRDFGEGNTNIYSAFSFDGGLTFTKNQKITTETTDFGTIGELNGEFGIGEYHQVVSSKNYAIAIWADGRKNNGDLDIYSAFFPITNNPSGVERITPISDVFQIKDISPNPATTNLNIHFILNQPGQISVYVYDISGSMLIQKQYDEYYFGENNLVIPVKDLPIGTYFIKLQVAGIYSLNKFIVNR